MPLLLETLVDATRFKGTCYRAANWVCLAETLGRGRMDRYHLAPAKPAKLIFVLPLHRHVQQRLCSIGPPQASLADIDEPGKQTQYSIGRNSYREEQPEEFAVTR